MIVTDFHSTAPRVLRRPGPAEEDAEFTVSSVTMGVHLTHDAGVLLAALEQLETQRRALEWLVERDLLWRCLADRD